MKDALHLVGLSLWLFINVPFAKITDILWFKLNLRFKWIKHYQEYADRLMATTRELIERIRGKYLDTTSQDH